MISRNSSQSINLLLYGSSKAGRRHLHSSTSWRDTNLVFIINIVILTSVLNSQGMKKLCYMLLLLFYSVRLIYPAGRRRKRDTVCQLGIRHCSTMRILLSTPVHKIDKPLQIISWLFLIFDGNPIALWAVIGGVAWWQFGGGNDSV